MIQSVEKKYCSITNQFSSYKIIYEDGTEWNVPQDEANRHYQEILEWVENGGVIVDNGA